LVLVGEAAIWQQVYSQRAESGDYTQSRICE